MNDEYFQINKKLDLILKHFNIEDCNFEVKSNTDIDRIILKINQYKEESIDPNFDVSLDKTLNELYKIRSRINELDNIVEQNYQIYLQNKDSILQNKQEQNKNLSEQNKNLTLEKPQEKPKQKKEIEYKIGGEIFGFIGAMLILIGMITLGKSILPEILQGLALFIIPVLTIGIAEFFEKKYSQKFSNILSGIGIAMSYIAIFINYFYINTFGSFTAIILSLLFTIGSMMYSKKKDNTTAKTIGMIGFYLSIASAFFITGIENIIVLSICLALISTIDLLIKTKPSKLYSYINSTLNFIEVIIIGLMFNQLTNSNNLGPIILIFLLISSYIIYFKANKDKTFNIFNIIILCVETGILSILFKETIICYIIMTTIPILFYLFEKKNENKLAYLVPSLITAIPLMNFQAAEILDQYIAIPYMLLVSIISFIIYSFVIQQNKINKFEIINTISIILFLFSGIQISGAYSIPIIIISLLAFIFLENKRELTLWFILPIISFGINNTVDYAIVDYMLSFSVLAIMNVAFTLLFKYYKQIRTEKTHIAFTALTVYSIICCLSNFINFEENFIFWIITVAASIFTISIINNKDMNSTLFEQNKLKIIAIMSTLFIFTIPNASNILISILMILLAVLTIYCGVYKQDKGLRIYGLGLSLIMIVKLMLFDISANSDIGKVILFFTCGILILSISYLYIKIEKKISKK